MTELESKNLNINDIEVMTDETLMPFGKHRGIPLGNIPPQYLLWLRRILQRIHPYLSDTDGELLSYLNDNKNILEMKYMGKSLAPFRKQKMNLFKAFSLGLAIVTSIISRKMFIINLIIFSPAILLEIIYFIFILINWEHRKNKY